MSTHSTTTPALSSAARSRQNRTWGNWQVQRVTSCGAAKLLNLVTSDEMSVIESRVFPGVFRVRSNGHDYRVDLNTADCQCPDHQQRRKGTQETCKHVAAVVALRWHQKSAARPRLTLDELNALCGMA